MEHQIPSFIASTEDPYTSVGPNCPPLRHSKSSQPDSLFGREMHCTIEGVQIGGPNTARGVVGMMFPKYVFCKSTNKARDSARLMTPKQQRGG